MRSYDHFTHLNSHIAQEPDKVWTQNIALLEGSLEKLCRESSVSWLKSFSAPGMISYYFILCLTEYFSLIQFC